MSLSEASPSPEQPGRGPERGGRASGELEEVLEELGEVSSGELGRVRGDRSTGLGRGSSEAVQGGCSYARVRASSSSCLKSERRGANRPVLAVGM